MDAQDWTVLVLEPNKFEAQIIADVLRAAGVQRIRVVHEPAAANRALEVFPADVVIAAIELEPLDGAAWTKAFRRNKRFRNRKASIFLTSYAFSRAIAEQCRHAGANALIGKPISNKALLETIKKVLSAPRDFYNLESYGPP